MKDKITGSGSKCGENTTDRSLPRKVECVAGMSCKKWRRGAMTDQFELRLTEVLRKFLVGDSTSGPLGHERVCSPGAISAVYY